MVKKHFIILFILIFVLMQFCVTTQANCIFTEFVSSESQNRDDFSIYINASYLLVDNTIQVNCSNPPTGVPIYWNSNKTSVATVNSTGVITGISEGSAKITATYFDPATNSIVTDYLYVSIRDSIGVKDNTEYHLMNYYSRKYLSLDLFADVNNMNVSVKTRSDSSIAKWKTVQQSDGSYQLQNVYSTSGKVLNVTGTNIDIYSNTGANTQKFTIYRIISSSFHGLYYIRYGEYYVGQDTNNNVFLTTVSSTKTIWSLMPVEKRDARLYSFQYTGFNTTANNTLFNTTMTDLGYSSFSNLINKTPNEAYSGIKNTDDIFVFRGHGGAGLIAFYNSSGTYIGDIAVNSYVSSSSSNRYIESCDKNELASLRIVLYIGCSTGVDFTYNDKTYNLVDSTHDKGAHFVLGTAGTVYTTDSNNFLAGFLNELYTNKSNVYSCIQSGIIQTGISYPVYYIGDFRQYLD